MKVLGYRAVDKPHMRRFESLRFDRLVSLLAVGVLAAMTVIIWFGYRAVVEWRNSSALLAERQASKTADLMREAFTRDMSGVQHTVLTSPQLMQFAFERPHEIADVIASAFARYLYPETFFVWKDGHAVEKTVFFCRHDRRASWAAATADQVAFPVVVVREAKVAGLIFKQIFLDAGQARRLSAFELPIDGTRYQVVALLSYSDMYRDHLAGVVGFIVHLPWARRHYFPELSRQAWDSVVGSEANLALSLTASDGDVIVGSAIDPDAQLTQRTHLRPLFFDPDFEPSPPRAVSRDQWTLAVSASNDPVLRGDIVMARRIVGVGAVSAMCLIFGLSLVLYASRARADLTRMRSDFVSAVTHELKTPIATIKAAAETLSKDRLTGMSFQTCGRIVMMEASHLSHLVDNLLAYSRIADVADTYTFEPLNVDAVFNDVQQATEGQLDQRGFELSMTIASGVPRVRADRSALRLLFVNLVDNAMKYSGAERRVLLNARQEGAIVKIEVVDSGVGIPPAEIPLVTQKFVRGRQVASGGSGLGLAIAKRIAEDHGGTLNISSVVGTGTTVTVTLPTAV
jgi:signal transduction histidine kinase